jgi:hypothetical protein
VLPGRCHGKNGKMGGVSKKKWNAYYYYYFEKKTEKK